MYRLHSFLFKKMYYKAFFLLSSTFKSLVLTLEDFYRPKIQTVYVYIWYMDQFKMFKWWYVDGEYTLFNSFMLLSKNTG